MDLKEIMLEKENNLSAFASLSKDAIRLNKDEEDIRPEYFRDIDRIIHSESYNRYIDKTQVFSNIKNDHISKRMIHVQLVSKIGRTIGRALSLNEDLIEAAALGHDIGHTPFGHLGESFLNKLSMQYDNTYFMHNVESVRELMFLEKHGKGLNLTIQVLDAILCHNGEAVNNTYTPVYKTTKDFLNDYHNCYKVEGYSNSLHSMTLEGCVVRISDVIAYIGRDIEDAIRLGLISSNDIPKHITDVLGNTNTKIVNTIILDIINNSLGKNYITMSEEVFNAINQLKDFNYKYIYSRANSKAKIEEINDLFNTLFDHYINAIKRNDNNDSIIKDYLKYMSMYYNQNTTAVRKTIDFIAGMTDDYALSEYKKIKELHR